MTWVAGRQFRTQGLLAIIFLAAAALYLGITGSSLHDLFSSSGLGHCRGTRGCGPSERAFLSSDSTLKALLRPLAVAIPGIVGIFWGAPLVARELDSGTYRLAWTQGITRRHWLAVKVALVGLAAVGLTELFSLLADWWYEPIQKLELNHLSPGVFDTHGIVPIGYAAVAFALGLLLGTVIRRPVPAMAGTLVGFIAVRLAGNAWIRPHLGSATHATHALATNFNIGFQVSPSGVTLLGQTPPLPNDWVLSSGLVQPNGVPASQATLGAFVHQHCPVLASHVNSQPPESAFSECEAAAAGAFHQVITYIPAGQFWTMQILELAVYLGLAILLIAFCFWWIEGRIGGGGWSPSRLLRLRSTRAPSGAPSPGAV